MEYRGEEKVHVLCQPMTHFHSVSLTSICTVLPRVTLPALLTRQERKHHVFLETWFLESYAVKGIGFITSHCPDFRLLSVTSQDGLGKSNSVTCCRGWVGMTQCSVSLKVGPVGKRGS